MQSQRGRALSPTQDAAKALYVCAYLSTSALSTPSAMSCTTADASLRKDTARVPMEERGGYECDVSKRSECDQMRGSSDLGKEEGVWTRGKRPDSKGARLEEGMGFSVGRNTGILSRRPFGFQPSAGERLACAGQQDLDESAKHQRRGQKSHDCFIRNGSLCAQPSRD